MTIGRCSVVAIRSCSGHARSGTGARRPRRVPQECRRDDRRGRSFAGAGGCREAVAADRDGHLPLHRHRGVHPGVGGARRADGRRRRAALRDPRRGHRGARRRPSPRAGRGRQPRRRLRGGRRRGRRRARGAACSRGRGLARWVDDRGQDGTAHGRGSVEGVLLRRNQSHPLRSASGPRPRRSGPGLDHDRGSARRRAARRGGAAPARDAPAARSPPAAAGLPARAPRAWSPLPAAAVPRRAAEHPARAAHQLHRPGGRARRSRRDGGRAPADHAGRGGGLRQDAPCGPAGGGRRRAPPRWGVVDRPGTGLGSRECRAGCDDRPGTPRRPRSRTAGAHHRLPRRPHRPPRRRQLRARARTGGRTCRRHPPREPQRRDRRDEPGAVGDRRGGGLEGAPAHASRGAGDPVDGGAAAVGGGTPVHRPSGGRASHLPRGHGPLGGCRGHLRTPRRDAPGHRARRGPGPVPQPGAHPRRARPAFPPPDRGLAHRPGPPADPPGLGRVEPRPAW